MIKHRLGALCTAVGRRLNLHNQKPLIFVWKKRRRQITEHHCHTNQQKDVYDKGSLRVTKDFGDRVFVTNRAVIKHSVKPDKKALLFFLTMASMGFEHRGTQRWCEHQSNKNGQPHRGDNRDRELSIDDAG
ncbi:hypothetical protein D3C87_1492740 [compost metagenome]